MSVDLKANDAQRLVIHFPAGPARRRLCVWGWIIWGKICGGKVEVIAND